MDQQVLPQACAQVVWFANGMSFCFDNDNVNSSYTSLSCSQLNCFLCRSRRSMSEGLHWGFCFACQNLQRTLLTMLGTANQVDGTQRVCCSAELDMDLDKSYKPIQQDTVSNMFLRTWSLSMLPQHLLSLCQPYATQAKMITLASHFISPCFMPSCRSRQDPHNGGQPARPWHQLQSHERALQVGKSASKTKSK